jgi:chromosomal replication initiation ATPase DnaA
VILRAVAAYFAVNPDDIINSVSRGGGAQGALLHRHVAIYLIRKDLHVNLDVIANEFKRTRTTIIRTIRTVDTKLENGARRYHDAIEEVRRNLSLAADK